MITKPFSPYPSLGSDLSPTDPRYTIYFTIDGTTPNPDDRSPSRSTVRYRKPFRLEPGRHTIKALSVATGSRNAAPSSVACKRYEVGLTSPGRRSDKSRRKVDPNIRAELVVNDDGVDPLGYPGNEPDSSEDDEAFTEREYLAARAKFRLRQDLTDFGVSCELCKAPRGKDKHGVLLPACSLCGYRFPELGSKDFRETRVMAAKLETPSPTKGVVLEPYVTADSSGVTVPAPGAQTRHHFSDPTGVHHSISASTAIFAGGHGLDENGHPLLHTRTLESVVNPQKGSGGLSDAITSRHKQDYRASDTDVALQRSPVPSTTTPHQPPAPTYGPSQSPHSGVAVPLHSPTTAKTRNFKRCSACSFVNPAHLTKCATCEASLVKVEIMGVSPPRPASTRHGVGGPTEGTCPNCSTVNSPSSRFCNWCGYQFPAKPSKLVPTDLSDRITTGGGDHSVMQQFTMLPDGTMTQIEQPADRPQQLNWGYHLDTTLDKVGPSTHSTAIITDAVAATGLRHNAGGKTGRGQKKGKKLKDTGSQTGLFFPSSKTLEMEKMRMETAIEGTKSERTIFVGEISPGNGYWRQQIDHALAKLKAFARETPKFQLQMGQHRMGDVTGAQIRQDGDQILLTVSLNDKKFDHKKKSAHRHRVFEGVTYSANQSMAGTQTPINEFLDQNGTLPPLEKLEPVAKKKSNREAEARRMSKITKALFVAVGPDGSHTKAETILGLLDQGADPNGFNADRDRPLHVAAFYGRVEAVTFLLDAKANPDAAGNGGDSPLHAAVRGDARHAKEVISLLIQANAQTDSQNIDTLTPCGLAGDLGKKHLVSYFGKMLSDANLDTLSKSKIRNT